MKWYAMRVAKRPDTKNPSGKSSRMFFTLDFDYSRMPIALSYKEAVNMKEDFENDMKGEVEIMIVRG